MEIARRTKKYVAKPEQTDSIFFDVRYQFAYNKLYAKKTLAHIDKYHLELKDSLYHSDTLFHLHYIRFVFDLYQSFKRAFHANPELAVKTLHKSYSELIEYLTKTGEKLSLATFYCLHLEKPDKTGKILANAAMYTIGSAFFILYASYLAHQTVKTVCYTQPDGTPANALDVAKGILRRNMAMIESTGVLAVSVEDDEGDERMN